MSRKITWIWIYRHSCSFMAMRVSHFKYILNNINNIVIVSYVQLLSAQSSNSFLLSGVQQKRPEERCLFSESSPLTTDALSGLSNWYKTQGTSKPSRTHFKDVFH